MVLIVKPPRAAPEALHVVAVLLWCLPLCPIDPPLVFDCFCFCSPHCTWQGEGGGQAHAADNAPFKLPRGVLMESSEFDTLRFVEGFSGPTSKITLKLGGELHATANIGPPSLKLLGRSCQKPKLVVPALLTSAGKLSNRKFYGCEWLAVPHCVQTAKRVTDPMVIDLNAAGSHRGKRRW